MIAEDFSTLVTLYKDKVFNTCLGFVKNSEDAKDLAQEVFVEIYRKGTSFRGESHLSTWIYRIAVNKSLEYIRKNSRQKRNGSREAMNPVFETTEFNHPGVKLENQERSRLLFAAIESLPTDQKVAFTLQKVEGLTVAEISKVMAKTTSSVESLLHRAKENLRTKLKTYYDEQ